MQEVAYLAESGASLPRLGAAPGQTNPLAFFLFYGVFSVVAGFNILERQGVWMAKGVHLNELDWKTSAGLMAEQRMIKMRLFWVVPAVLMGITATGLAQQSNEFKVKHSTPEKTKKSAALPVGKTAGPGTASASNSKDLQALEHETVKTSGTRAGGKKASPALKPVRDKSNSNPPINFNGSGGAKSAGMANQGANPYKGRLRQKGKQQR